MSKTPKYWNTAKKYLSKKDKTMSFLIKNINLLQKQYLPLEKMFFIHYVKVLLVNKLV